MNKAASFHPDAGLMRRFLDGVLPMGASIAVSAHVQFCDVCAEAIAKQSEQSSSDWYDHIEQEWERDFSDILESVVEQPSLPLDESAVQIDQQTPVQLMDRRVVLPPVLAKLTSSELAWKQIASGIHQALVDVDPETKFEFICMEPAATVPRHTHLGYEMMLVLQGDITDDLGEYAAMDFVYRDQQDEHGQITNEGCVCLFVTDAPLLFREGKAKLINPINRLKHWWGSGKRG
ncbi:MAG: ChrR family anti-sigma-E factor [Gammaproteobacteria bacterium]